MDIVTILVLAFCFSFQLTTAEEHDDHFVNEWAAEITGGERVAREIASEYGYELVKEISGLPNHYVFRRSDVPHRSRRSASHHTKRLEDDRRVSYVAQQQEKRRVKREMDNRDLARDIVARDGLLDDPQYKEEWYLFSDTNSNKRASVRADLRVKEVWKKGITGKNVVVTICDDGLESNHTDLAPNYDPKASYDVNDNDDDPFPRYDITNENKHGTRCAGEVAMVANNNKCGVGIAFDSKIGGIRMLDGRVTDHSESDALSFNKNHIDIYSSSWGPNDDGKTLEGPGVLTRKALELGVKEGRNGKGVLFAWASGNGGRIEDNCNCDGYTSSIYTLSVSSASQYGNSPYYSEKCSSTLTSTYSSGSFDEGRVISADLHNMCTHDHTGTSAAAPMAAGILALLLEANPNLTWRDVQHIVVHTSRMEPLGLEKGWYKNGAGYCVNLRFGFGLMDALAMVELADPATWKHVGEQHVCKVEAEEDTMPQTFSPNNYVEVEIKTDGCQGQENEVNYVEHVQIVVDIEHNKRGNIFVEVESPMGTITPLMTERKYDVSNKGFKEWALMSVHNWGEQPQGTWKIRVGDRVGGNGNGTLVKASLVVYGTKEQPEYQNNPKNCGDVQEFAKIYSDGDLLIQKELVQILDDLQNTTDTETVEKTMSKLQNLLNSKPGGQKEVESERLKSVLQNLESAMDQNHMSDEDQKNIHQAFSHLYSTT